ncbi:AMIN-like domain-containing (lipo)protein [Rhodococcus sp. WAY2]|uniref:AMIN-like domain-containing (lipo)protein n=1 Tax=Rhodococcus sp. WAY2 TaxID=2663121 RepID=UPI00131F48B9|nr:hypothetical protein [Rhodococcus sp. WAY2]QHE72780.1 hypothetical protein GFS60_06428 [Rhodococcus sp. WAY2]
MIQCHISAGWADIESVINRRGLAGLIALVLLPAGCAAPDQLGPSGGGQVTTIEVPGADANAKEGPCMFCPKPPVAPPPVTQPPERAPVPPTIPRTPTIPPTAAPLPGMPRTPAPIDSWEPTAVTDIRIERHEGYDRIIYGFGGTAVPSWRAEYLAEATPRGQPTALQVRGVSILQIYFFATSTATDTGGYSGPTPLTDPYARAVTEVHLAPSYQSHPHSADLSTQTFIGTSSDRPPFKVEVLFDPLAMAVDIFG